MNTYLFDYQHSNTPTITGTCSLVAENDHQAVELFHQCDDSNRVITRMVRAYVGGKRVDEEIVCYPYELGGGPVDLWSEPVTCPDCRNARNFRCADHLDA